MTWQTVEQEIREIASTHWSAPCVSEVIAGVQCDGVIRLRRDYYILIEMSERDDLNKLRDDMTKLTTVKNALAAQGAYAERYFVTAGENHPSLRTTAAQQDIEFHTVSTFSSQFIGSAEYLFQRDQVPFGSAVKPDSGESDNGPYTRIGYQDSKGKSYLVSDIAQALRAGKQVVLLGEFGTGKSRCIKETFEEIAKDTNSAFVPLAINLRDNWGYRRFDHILRNHLDGLGLSQYADNVVKSVRRGNHPLLLDGFDEIGSQSWTGEVAALAQLRRQSLEGVRDAIESSGNAGVMLTGREQYFSSDDEMYDSLGLRDDALVLRCPDEFTDQEAQEYLANSSVNVQLPEWMPRKPLICQLLLALDPDELKGIEESASGEVAFFEQIVEAVCRRETRINAAIDAPTIRRILLRLAQGSRNVRKTEERLAMSYINQTFMDITGFAPVGESAVLLQRLPYLGRIRTESSDRVFIDDYALNGLRGLAMREMFATRDEELTRSSWKQPLNPFGLRVWAASMTDDKSALKYARRCVAFGNDQAAADFVASRLLLGSETVNFENLTVSTGSMSLMAVVDQAVSNLTLINVHIEQIALENFELNSVVFAACLIERVSGVSSPEQLPPAFGPDCHVDQFDDQLSSAKISTLPISDAQKTLLAIIKKLFLQPGSGRREEALLRGTEAYWHKSGAESAIKYMLANGLIRRFKRGNNVIYTPQRAQMKRVSEIAQQQKRSADPLWALMES